ncbi:MAG: succinyl-diaminopimelate desuccinylase [Jatrophihabitans sp.]
MTGRVQGDVVRLDLSVDAAGLTAALVDVESVSENEVQLTDAVESALRALPALAVDRYGNVVVARTMLGAVSRVVLAGHLDTVPIADNVPSIRDGDVLRGCGTSDMKSGDAVALRIAYLVGTGALQPATDLTWIFYDCEEIAAERNGLTALARDQPADMRADLAILLEPTGGVLEGGCQGTMRAVARLTGRRAHSARSWLGVNAVHAAAPLLQYLADYRPRRVVVDGLEYREGLNAVAVEGGVAGNVIPDECRVTVNFRFAPDRSEAEAEAHVREVLAGVDVEVIDSAPGARPGMDAPLTRALAAAVGGEPRAKLGWTDVARFARLGVPAVNFGPGDPNLAHTREEWVSAAAVGAAEESLVRFLTSLG